MYSSTTPHSHKTRPRGFAYFVSVLNTRNRNSEPKTIGILCVLSRCATCSKDKRIRSPVTSPPWNPVMVSSSTPHSHKTKPRVFAFFVFLMMPKPCFVTSARAHTSTPQVRAKTSCSEFFGSVNFFCNTSPGNPQGYAEEDIVTGSKYG